MNKVIDSAAAAVADVGDGATVMVSGFGPPGQPEALVSALLESGANDLTIINNNAGAGGIAISALFAARRVRKVVCSFPKAIENTVFDELYHANQIELELVPQGTLAERIRAGSSGVPAFFTPTGFGTELAEGKETMVFNGRPCVLERALRADVALIRAHRADPSGNLIYRKVARNFGPIMAGAATTTIAEVGGIVSVGDLDPEHIVTPGALVQRVVLGAKAPCTSSEA